MYDAVDLSTMPNGGNSSILLPASARKASSRNLESIQDLVNYDDF